ncbi:MAG TPA: SMP-30/gluconolactonase/LRE family protein [Devosia sp.]|jgi:sugar lactone lactonase YvrE|uniref:SMP-30/gluconolactonase/LRE family protein n=1 Tax=Devosia sp. TaxID=1871048 RepID=UPI002DDD9B88|nr:SMP-30/gluconolactonase/LRE family protein [Devosia sp.]HEV2514349.1 SMP-30/gluconolactonase/LRE family protein [Devosia sp.]
MSHSEVVCVAPVGDRCGEAAVWSHQENAIYWVDVMRFLVHRLDCASGSVRSWHFMEPVVALALTSDPDRMLVALASKLVYWWPKTDVRRDHGFSIEGYPEVRLNDGRADPIGNFWLGSMKNNLDTDAELKEGGKGHGVLFRVASDGSVSRWRDGLGISNTLCWSPAGDRFYFGDTLENELYEYDFASADASVRNERSYFAGFDRGLPDGSSIDSEGYVWNCRFGGGCIVRVSPLGQVDRVVEMPVQNVTTCTFGGPDLKTLFVTSASIVSPRGNRLAGSLFSMQVDVPGMAENRYLLDE